MYGNSRRPPRLDELGNARPFKDEEVLHIGVKPNNGNTNGNTKTNTNFVWPVRGGE